jgi:NADH:ubiquinone oxidoreductase subunit 4 (subunit M)
MFPILALLIALPIAFLVAETFLRDRYGTLLSTASALISLILVLALVYYAFTNGGISLSESYSFLAYLSVPFALRVTPIPLMLLVMSSAIIFVAALSSSFNNSGKTHIADTGTCIGILRLYQRRNKPK